AGPPFVSSAVQPIYSLPLPSLPWLRGSHRLAALFRRVFDGLYNMLIPGTAAEIASYCLSYLVPGWIRLTLEQLAPGHNHPRRPTAALQTMALPKPFLHWLITAVLGQPLHR